MASVRMIPVLEAAISSRSMIDGPGMDSGGSAFWSVVQPQEKVRIVKMIREGMSMRKFMILPVHHFSLRGFEGAGRKG